MNKSMSLENEVWVSVKEYGYCDVSNHGRIRTNDRHVKHWRGGLKLNKGKILSPILDGSGYLYVTLFNKLGKRKRFTVHRLIARAFIVNKENKPQVNHINGIKNDNRLVNLEWVTASENAKHAIKNGLFVAAKGIKSGASKLTEEMVIKIRSLSKTRTQSELATMFSVDQGNISCIVNRKIWKHI